jgi:hypothetical protein
MGLLVFVKALKIRDIIIITIISILSIGVHNSHFYICLCLLFLLLMGSIFNKVRKTYDIVGIKLKRLFLILLLIFCSQGCLGLVHYVFSGSFKSSRGGIVFLMSNVVEMGVMDIYLDENCGHKNYKICAYKDSLPNNFLWDVNSPIKKTGGWAANEDEYSVIVKDIMSTPRYLKTLVYKSAIYTVKQFFNYDMADISKAGDRVNNAVRDNYDDEYNGFLLSRENTNTMQVGFINFTQDVIVSICLIIYFFVLVNKKTSPRNRFFILFILSCLIINAWICSTFSGVFPRYQTRVIWMLPLPLFLHLARNSGVSSVLKKIMGNN